MQKNMQTFDIQDRTVIIDTDNMYFISVNTDGYDSSMLLDENSKINKSFEYLKQIKPLKKNNYLNSIYLLVTEKCNLSCEFCSIRANINKAEKEHRVLNKADVERMYPNLKYFNPRKIFITGGEPMMNDEVLEIAQYLRENTGAFITMQSNGLLVNESNISRFKECVDEIDISTAHYTNVDSIYQKIQLCKKNNIKLVLTYVYENSIEKLLRIIELAIQNDVVVLISFVALIGSALDNEYENISFREILSINRDIIKFILDHNYEDSLIAKTFLNHLTLKKSCSALGNTMAIYPDGSIYMCHSLKNDDFYIGNFINDESKNIENKLCLNISNDDIKKLFDVDHKGECKDCNFRYFCTGYCGASIYNNTYNDESCKMSKFNISYILVNYNRKASVRDNLSTYLEKCNEVLEEMNDIKLT